MSPDDLHRELIHKGRVFEMFREQLALPNGVHTHMDVIRHPGAAAILAVTADERLLMLEQYRHAIGRSIWEIPAGTLEPDESPLACAQRELVEESGFSAGRWDVLGTIFPLPGYSDEKIHLFMAGDLQASTQRLDEDEIIQVRKVPFDEVLNMIDDGRILDAKTITAVFLSMRLKRHRQSCL